MQCRVQPETTHPATDSLMFVHCHQPVQKTFAKYANEIFRKKISNITKNYIHVHIVFDAYKLDSLKSFTQKPRGDGSKRQSFTIQQSAKKLESIFEKQPQQNRIVCTSSKEYIFV